MISNHPAEVLTGLVGSVLALVTVFGIDITDVQIAAIMGVVAWVPAVVTGIVNAVRKHRTMEGE